MRDATCNCLLKLFVDLFLRNAKLFGNLLVTLSLQPPGLEYLLRQFRHLFELGPAYFENFVPEQDVRVATLDSSGIVIHCAALFEFDLFVYGLSYLLIPAIHQAIVPDDFIQIGFDVRPVNVVRCSHTAMKLSCTISSAVLDPAHSCWL